MHIEISIGSQYFPSNRVLVKEGRCKWYEELRNSSGDDISVTFPQDIEQVPDIFVYLCHKTKRISFKRFKFADIVKKNWKNPPGIYFLFVKFICTYVYMFLF